MSNLWIQSSFGGTNATEHVENDLGPADSPVGDVWHYRPYSNILSNGNGSALLEPAPPQPKIVAKVAKLTLSGASTKPLRRTIKIDVPAGQYEVRMRRKSPDETDSKNSSSLNWVSLKTYQPDRTAYPGQNRLGMVIKASGQLNGMVQQLSATATQRVAYREAGVWKYGASTNPAWMFLDFCLGRRAADGTELYGCFLSHDEIDFEAIDAWAAFCITWGLHCSMVLDQPQTAGDVLDNIARCGLASVSRASGKVGVVWDAPGLPASSWFGMSNIIKGSYSIEYATENLADEIVVSFVNPKKNWAQDQVRVLCPGVTAPTRTTTISLIGCCSETMAGLYANYLAAQQYYRCRRVSWETDFEGLSCQRGDVILNAHDLAQWGYSGRVVSVSGKVVTLDRAVNATLGSQSLWIVRPDGQIIAGVTTLAAAGAFDTLTLLAEPVLQDNMLPMDHKWFFGPVGTPGKKLKVTDVEPLGRDGRIRIIATDEFPEFYAAWKGDWQAAPNVTLLANPVATITACDFSETPMSGGDLQIQLTLTTSGNYASSRAVIYVNDVLVNESIIQGQSGTLVVKPVGTLKVVLTPINATGQPGASVTYTHAIGSRLPGSTTTGSTTPGTSPGVSVSIDALGNASISFKAWSDPQITGYELRRGDSFEAGEKIAVTTGNAFTIPLLGSAGSTFWIRGRYSNGDYTTLQYKVDFSGQNLAPPQGVSWRIAEPALIFSWAPVPGAAQYIALFEDGGVTTIRTVAATEAAFMIPKWASTFRVIAMSSDGTLSKFVDEEVSISGQYHDNELLNVALPLTTGNYVNLAFTAANTIKRASLLGLAPVAPYAQNINDGDLYTFGYNLAGVTADNFAATPASWFRTDFWKIREGFFESSLVDLGAVYTGKLLLNLSKTINYVGSAPVSTYGHVLAEYMADATVQDLIDQKAFLTARFLVTAGNPGDPGWVEAANGDWVTARYVKIVVEVAMASPLTEVTVTAGAITIDVPDVTETGSKTGVTVAGSSITFAKSYHVVSVVLATARGAAKAWVTNVTSTGCTLWVDSGTQQVDYFVKGY